MVKKRIFTLFALFLAFVLSACGAKVNTELQLDTPTSGKRIITLVIPKLDETAKAKVNGGMTAVDASIKKHLPKEFTFSGFQQSGENTVGTLTLEFDSLETYKSKIAAILREKDSKNIDSMISVNTTGLVTGMQVKERFSSEQLLKWAINGLVEDGVIAKNDSSLLLETGDSKITFNGKSYNSTGSYLQVKDVVDNGVSHLAINIAEQKSSFDVQVKFGYREGTKYPEAELKAHLDKALPKNAKLSVLNTGENQIDGVNVNGQMVSYTADSIEEVAKSLSTLLGDPSFSIKDITTPRENGFPERKLKVEFNCSGVCSPDGRKLLEFKPADIWKLNGSKKLSHSGAISMLLPIRFSDFTVDSTIGKNGGKVVLTATLDAKIAELAGNSIEKALNRNDAGKIVSKKDGEKQIYTLTLSGDSETALNAAMRKLSANSGYKITADTNAGFFSDSVSFIYRNDFGRNFSLKEGGKVKQKLTIDGYSITKSTAGDSAIIEKTLAPGEFFSVKGTAAKTSVISWVIFGILLTLILLLSVFIFWKRKLIIEKWTVWKKTRAEKRATTAGVMSASGMASANYLPPTANVASTNVDFATNSAPNVADDYMHTTPTGSDFASIANNDSSANMANSAMHASKTAEWSESELI